MAEKRPEKSAPSSDGDTKNPPGVIFDDDGITWSCSLSEDEVEVDFLIVETGCDACGHKEVTVSRVDASTVVVEAEDKAFTVRSRNIFERGQFGQVGKIAAKLCQRLFPASLSFTRTFEVKDGR